MIDIKNRGTNDLEVIIYKLKKRNDILEKLIKKLKDQIKSSK